METKVKTLCMKIFILVYLILGSKKYEEHEHSAVSDEILKDKI